MLSLVFYLYVLINLTNCHPLPNNSGLKSYNDTFKYSSDPCVRRLQEYIRIDSSREENYESIVDFWKRQAAESGVSFAAYRPDGLPICVLTLQGRNPDLPSIMLNHHADVVAGAYEDQWTYPPFSGQIDENGDMFGRGTQDTKSIGIQYLEAVNRLIANNVTLERTVHITVMPDEETGGFRGIKPFIETDDFKSLNIGFALDEGFTSTDNVLLASYQDKRSFEVRYNIVGQGGHGSSLTNGSAIEKLHNLINTAVKFRDEQTKVMKSSSKMDFGAYTALNFNMIQNVSHLTLTSLLEYIYTGQVSVPSNNLSSFIETAKTLHIKGLENIDEGTNKEIHTPKNESNSSISRTVGIKRKASTSDQINLPLTARKVLVKHGGNTTITLGDKKSQNMSDNEDTNDFSIENAIQDTDTDYNDTKNDKDKGTAQLTSSNLQYTVSIRGSLQVILNRYIYNLNSSQSSGVRRWRCTDYRNKKCNAFVVTQDNIVLNRANPHNHSFHDKKILDKIEKNAVYSAIDDVKGVIEKEKPKDNHPMESEFVSLSFNTELDDLQDTKPL